MNRRRSPRFHVAAPLPSMEAVRFKLSRIVSRHEQLKIAFNQLNSQIRAGLLEAEDVFAALAIPLTKLVGLKTVEMAAEGRFSTIVTTADHSTSHDDNYLNKAMVVGNELLERQKLQIMQLIKLLKKIEAQVNFSQSNISQSVAEHQAFMKKFFVKAFTFVSAFHQSSQSSDLSLMMLKLLKATFEHVRDALGSVEAGVDDLICELAEKMCNPMVEYVNGLKVEMKAGTCSRLFEVVKEMDNAMRVKKLELEEARKEAILAEQTKFEALSRLKELERTSRKGTTPPVLPIDYDTQSEESRSEQKRHLPLKEDQAKDDNLLWELLRKKRRCLLLESPPGPKGLLGIETYEKKLNLTSGIPQVSRRPVTRSQAKRLDPQASYVNSLMLLGSSPSSLTQKVLCGKRITP